MVGHYDGWPMQEGEALPLLSPRAGDVSPETMIITSVAQVKTSVAQPPHPGLAQRHRGARGGGFRVDQVRK